MASPDHSTERDRMETAYSKPISGQTQAPHLLGLQELTRTSRCGQPSSPETFCLLPFTQVPITVASGTLQPSLHHHPLPHPPPVGKSPAAGWPLSTAFVLLHEMNCCGVGVGEARHTEYFWGSGWLGIPGFAHGDKGEQPAAQFPANLALPPCHSGFPRDGFGPSSSPNRGSAGSTTNPVSAKLLHFHFISPAGICPDVFAVPGSVPGSPVGGEGLLWASRT